jgi:hypothetical protein
MSTLHDPVGNRLVRNLYPSHVFNLGSNLSKRLASQTFPHKPLVQRPRTTVLHLKDCFYRSPHVAS